MHRTLKWPLIFIAAIAAFSIVVASIFVGRIRSRQLPAHQLPSSRQSIFAGTLRGGGGYQLVLRATRAKWQADKASTLPDTSIPSSERSETRLSAFECVINGKNIAFPDSSIQNLVAPNLDDPPKVEQQRRVVSFTLHGGQGLEAYEATFRIEPPNLIERRVQRSNGAVSVLLYQPEFPATLAGQSIPVQSVASATP